MVIGKGTQITLIFRQEDVTILGSMLASILVSDVYRSNRKHLPKYSEIAFLYLREYISFGTDTQSPVEINSPIEIRFPVGDVDMFINELVMRHKTDISLLNAFINNSNTNFITLESRIPFIMEQKETILALIRHVVKHYWDSRINGGYENAMGIAKVLMTLLHMEFSNKDKLLFTRRLDALIQDYRENHQPTKNPQSRDTLKVDKPGDLTLTLDYSFDRNKLQATYKLSSANKSIFINGLFKQNLLDFLTDYIINPLTLTSTEIKSGTIVIIEESMWQQMGRKRTYHIDHINSAIRKYIESENKFKCFSYKGRSIEVKICIQLVQKPAEEQFGRRKTT